MKFGVSLPDLMELDHQGYSVYGIVTSPGKIVVKPESFPEGIMPAHLSRFKGQNAKVAKACEGRVGLDWVRCLRDQSVKLGTRKKK